jgi:alpha/beta superfamily hydrolase
MMVSLLHRISTSTEEEMPILRARVPRPDAYSFAVQPPSKVPKKILGKSSDQFKKLSTKIHQMKPGRKRRDKATSLLKPLSDH